MWRRQAHSRSPRCKSVSTLRFPRNQAYPGEGVPVAEAESRTRKRATKAAAAAKNKSSARAASARTSATATSRGGAATATKPSRAPKDPTRRASDLNGDSERYVD